MVRLTDRPDMILDVYRGRKTTTQQPQQQRKRIVDTDVVNDVTDTRQGVITRVVIRFL